METSTKRFKCLQKLIGSSKLNTEPSILNSVLLGPSSNHFGTFCQNLQLDLKSSNHPSSARALKFCQAHSVMSTYYVSKVVKYSSFQTYFRTFEYLVHCVILADSLKIMKPLVDLCKDPKADNDTNAKKIPDFEDLVSKLGEFGLYQKILYLALWLPAASMSIGIYSSVFLEFVPDYHCDSPCFKDDPNLANHLKNLDDPTCTIPQPWLNSNHSTCQNGLEDIVKCQNFVYDQTIFWSTAITDFNVVCDNAYLRTLSTTVSMCGLLFGSMFFGWISDAMGRRVAFGLCMLTLALGSTLAAFSVNYVMYMVFRFITCMGGVGAFITAFVLATEFVGKNYRTYCGILIEVPFALGELYTTLLAYYIRDWKNLQASF